MAGSCSRTWPQAVSKRGCSSPRSPMICFRETQRMPDIVTDLFDVPGEMSFERETMAAGAVLLRGRALALEADILASLESVAKTAPFRRMTTPGSFRMPAAMTGLRATGEVTHRAG